MDFHDLTPVSCFGVWGFETPSLIRLLSVTTLLSTFSHACIRPHAIHAPIVSLLHRLVDHHLRHAFDRPPSRALRDFCIEFLSVLNVPCIAGTYARFAWGWRHFSSPSLPPMVYVANDGLSAFVNRHPFYTDGLLGFGAGLSVVIKRVWDTAHSQYYTAAAVHS